MIIMVVVLRMIIMNYDCGYDDCDVIAMTMKIIVTIKLFQYDQYDYALLLSAFVLAIRLVAVRLIAVRFADSPSKPENTVAIISSSNKDREDIYIYKDEAMLEIVISNFVYLIKID